jgi:hypothetical protein
MNASGRSTSLAGGCARIIYSGFVKRMRAYPVINGAGVSVQVLRGWELPSLPEVAGGQVSEGRGGPYSRS